MNKDHRTPNSKTPRFGFRDAVSKVGSRLSIIDLKILKEGH
jgi:hypothetical protein